jgi:hypothetical protein
MTFSLSEPVVEFYCYTCNQWKLAPGGLFDMIPTGICAQCYTRKAQAIAPQFKVRICPKCGRRLKTLRARVAHEQLCKGAI